MNIEVLLRDNIKQIQPYSSARDEYKDTSGDMVFLDANENPYQTTVNRYPDPQQMELKQAISELRGVPVNQMLLGNGSDEVLDLVFRAFCEPKEDNIITLPPTYGMYAVLANINAIDNREVPLSDDFQPRPSAIENVVDVNSKLLFLCSPNNPTANSLNAEAIETIIRDFRGIVVIDEAYIDFSNQESWLSRLEEFPNLIVTQTLSKAFGMAGIRLGICYASEAIISILNKIKPPYNINQLTQQFALSRLSKMDLVNQEVNLILNERQRILEALESIPMIKVVYATDANFILVKVDDANARYQQLIAKGIVVRNRTNQPLCENCLRLTIGTIEENNKLINTLKTL